MNFTKNPYFTVKEKMELLQRWILVHSIIYYVFHDSLVTDSHFDVNAMQLVQYKNKYPATYKKTKYYYCMYDFDGSTGFNLPSRLSKADRKKLYGDAFRLPRR